MTPHDPEFGELLVLIIGTCLLGALILLFAHGPEGMGWPLAGLDVSPVHGHGFDHPHQWSAFGVRVLLIHCARCAAPAALLGCFQICRSSVILRSSASRMEWSRVAATWGRYSGTDSIYAVLIFMSDGRILARERFRRS